MKKKLFTLLTLLLCVCSGAWADVTSPYTLSWLNKATVPATDDTSVTQNGITWTLSMSALAETNLKFEKNDKGIKAQHVSTFNLSTSAFASLGKITKITINIGRNAGGTSNANLSALSMTCQVNNVTYGTANTHLSAKGNTNYEFTPETAQTGDVSISITNTVDDALYIGSITVEFQNATAPSITTQPVGGVYQKDATEKELTVEATPSTGECAYQWYSCKNGDAEDTPVSLGSGNGAQTATYTIPTDTEGTFYYFCVVSDGGSNITPSDVATVHILDQTPVSTWNLSSLTANDIQYDSFWTGSDNTFTNASAIAGNTDTTIPNSFGGDLLNGIKIGAASGIAANNLFMFINYYGVYGLRVNATTYFKIPATIGKYYRITHTASMNDGNNTVGFAINNSSATLIDGELTAAISNVAVPNVFIIRADASTIELANAGTASGRTVLTKIEEMDVLSASWKRSEETVTSDSFYEGDTAPTIPTLNVTSSKGTSLTGTEYSVSYETSDADIVAVDPSTGITAIKNTKTGTATVTATLTTSTDGFMVVTNTYTYTVTVNAKVPTYTLDKADNEISLRSTPVHRNAEPAVSETVTVKMSADYLVGTSGTVAFVGEAVNGLSVSPAAFTITDGSVAETDFTITYNSASGASGTATLRFSDGTNNKDLVIEYASVVPHTLQDVTGTTTWDWSTMGSSCNVQLKDDGSTIPEKAHLYDVVAADFDSEVYSLNANWPDGFPAEKIAFYKSEWPVRYVNNNKSYYQGVTLKMHTTVPGTIQIWFSNTSTKDVARFLEINGTEYGDEDGNGSKTSTIINTAAIPVPAGDITITGKEGENANYVHIQKIIFTADNEIGQKSIDIVCEGGLASYSCTTDGLDFSTSNVKAYIVTASNTNSATLQEVTKAPANTGLIILGTKDETYNVLTTTEATAADVEGNLLEATGVSGSVVAKDEAYILSRTDGKFHLCNAGTIPAGKAYLPAGVNASRMLNLAFDDSETTGIQAVNVETKTILNGEFYNLNGQRVATPRKGLYIVNGKKVIIK